MQKHHYDSIVGFVRKIERNELFLPNIQRDLVWRPEQILFLIDSLFRGYPVGTLLIWRTRQDIECREFIRHYEPGMRFWDQPWTGKEKFKQYVLDGQQRLQALYIALLGSCAKQRVYLDLLPRDEDREAEMRYALHFRAADDPRRRPTEVLLGDLVLGDDNWHRQTKQQTAAFAKAGVKLAAAEEDQVGETIARVAQTFSQPDALSFFVADDTENPVFEDLDEVLEIFIRTNAGGTKLDPSDLIFSVVKADWSGVQALFENCLDDLNQRGNFRFTTDDLLRMCLVLTDKGAAYSLERFRGKEAKANVAAIKNGWPSILEAILWVADFVRGDAQLRTDDLLISYNALLPLMMFVHRTGPSKIGVAERHAMRRWLYRVLLERQFGGASVSTINRCVNVIQQAPRLSFPELPLYREIGLSDQPSQESVLDRGKRSPQESVLPLFIAYMDSGLGFPDMNPFHSGNMPEVDHIVPKSKVVNLYEQAGREVVYGVINNVGNYRVVAKDENRHKSDKWPREFYGTPEAWNAFRARHLLPGDVSLDQPIALEVYERFVEARRKMLFERIRNALTPQAT